MSLSPGMSWAQVLDSLSPPPVSLLEGPEQASQQEAWLNPPSLRELHILILPWQRERAHVPGRGGDGSTEPGPEGGTQGEALVGLPSLCRRQKTSDLEDTAPGPGCLSSLAVDLGKTSFSTKRAIAAWDERPLPALQP
ncbi:hypothetical protein HJG60_009237 [Phyllostomus discolor]|uniref:Uncharacterized protein n=1 Tax=Phyllostomus discolor TaxID=89673 RepID=A0A834DCZ0_9CHIR|nr:hypothetical protein HJG60_009237 [Phyllostomus discolor]